MTIYDVAKLVEGHILQKFVQDARPYKLPKGYLKWDVFTSLLAINLANLYETGTDLAELVKLRTNDRATVLMAHRSVLWFVKDAPLYCISNEMLREFEETDILDETDLLADLEIPHPNFMVMLPDNAVKSSEGANVPFCIINVSDIRHPEWSTGEALGIKAPYIEHEHSRNVNWCAVDANENIWISAFGMKDDGTCTWEDNQLGADATTPKDTAFLSTMRSITLQILLTLAYMPELLSEGEQGRRHRKKHEPRESSVQSPRWIGKTYKRVENRTPKGGSHSSPRGHWRRSHWRRVAVGVGRLNREWRKIPRKFINAGQENYE